MIATLLASSRGRGAALAGALVVSALLTAAPGSAARAAGRAGIAVSLLALGVALVRGRARHSGEDRIPRVEVISRATIVAGAGVALLRVDGRPFLVGFGKDGVRLLADLDRSDVDARP